MALAPGRATDRRLRAMGTDVHLVAVDADDGALDDAEALLGDLERRWSRFLPDSELCRINDHPGLPVLVSEPTFSVVRQAVDGWWSTHGRYDPTVLPALLAAGYDRPFRELAHRDAGGAPSSADPPVAPSPGCAEVELLAEIGAVIVPEGVALDLGGIGKGAAADRIVEALLDSGAEGACANVGGDVRVGGTGPEGAGWVVGVTGADGGQLAVLSLASGGIATTSPATRRWTGATGEVAHHLIDPGTGRPARMGPRSVTVVAGEAAAAEVLAKAVWLAPDEAEETLGTAGAACLVVGHDDVTTTSGPWEDLLA